MHEVTTQDAGVAGSSGAPAATPVAPARVPLVYRYPRALTTVILLAMTLAAGWFRFSTITRPALWNDEALTFGRVGGDYRDLLDYVGKRDGFAPLHYEIYWFLGHLRFPKILSHIPGLPSSGTNSFDLDGNPAERLTPVVMRVIPSLAGTLMVPAMYFLARQLCSRRTSLLSAAFAGCSAYLMVYAHDAKMYMHFWLCCVLMMGSLLWWLRTGRRVAWLAWVTAGTAACGLHAPGMVLLGLAPLLVITHSWRTLAVTLVLGGLGAGVYLAHDYDPELGYGLLVPLAVAIVGALVVGAGYHFGRRRVVLAVWPAARPLVLMVLGVAVIGSGPAGYYLGFNRWLSNVNDNGWGDSGLNWIPEYLAGRDGPDLLRYATTAFLYSWEYPKKSEPNYQPKRTVPVNDGRSYVSMLDGDRIHPKVMAGLTAACGAIAVGCFVGLMPWPGRVRARRAVAGVETGVPTAWYRTGLWLIVWLVVPCYAFYCQSMPGFLDNANRALAQGQKPYLPGFAHPTDWVSFFGGLINSQWWLIGGAVAGCVVVFALHRFVARIVAALMVVCAIAMTWVLWGRFVPVQADDVPAWLRRFYLARYWVMSMLESRALVVGLIILVPALVIHCSSSKLRGRIANALLAAAIVGVTYGLCVVVYGVFAVRDYRTVINTGPVWMPRYLGICWGPFAIVVSALLLRLPTRPVRYAAVALLLGVNLMAAWARLTPGSEPRIDLMAADVWPNQDSPTTRVYTEFVEPASAHPAGADIRLIPAKYYFSMLRKEAIAPRLFRDMWVPSIARLRADTSDGTLISDAQSVKTLVRIVVWDRLPFGDEPPPRGEAVAAQLGKGWSLKSVDFYPVRYHWNWTDLYISRRREFVKAGGR